MTATDYEALPQLAVAERDAHADVLVMKFGGSSVADTARLKAVAHRLVRAREAGNRVVGVLSAMGDTTDELIALASQMSARPHPREMDMLISVGERISCALAAMVINDLGHEAISLTGSQAGIVTDTSHTKARIVEVRADRIRSALDDGKIVLLEGAQATLLDVDHGTYPFVTSSSPVAGGALAGAGVGPSWIDRVMGIAKAYVTRVGAGPFPTEADEAEAEVLRAAGDEFGTTTGRPRRCGWLDTVGLRYAARVNGLTELFVTKLDVLSRLERVPVAVAYRIDGQVTEDWPMTQTEIHHAEPVYELFDGWREDISGVTRLEDLPRAARAYVDAVEKLGGVPVTAVGVGPGREQTLVRTTSREE